MVNPKSRAVKTERAKCRDFAADWRRRHASIRRVWQSQPRM